MNEDKLKILNILYPIRKLLDTKNNRSNIKCPNSVMHKNNDKTPSAHVYDDVNAIFCFTCHRFYRVGDLIKYNNLDVNVLYNEVESLYKGQDILKIYEDLKPKEKKIIKKNENENFINFTEKYFLK